MHVNIFSFSGVYSEEDFRRMCGAPSEGADIRFFDAADGGSGDGEVPFSDAVDGGSEDGEVCVDGTESADIRFFNVSDDAEGTDIRFFDVSDDGSESADIRFSDAADGGEGGGGVSFYDLSDIEGTNGYLSDEARTVICGRISDAPVNAVNFIDNGNTHYMSDILCARVSEPFILILIDHHTDMQPPAFGGLESCGSWVRSAMELNPMLKGTMIIGPDEEQALTSCGDDVEWESSAAEDLTGAYGSERPVEANVTVADGTGRQGNNDLAGAYGSERQAESCLCGRYAGKPVILLPEAVASAEEVRGCVRKLQEMCVRGCEHPETYISDNEDHQGTTDGLQVSSDRVYDEHIDSLPGIYISIDKDILDREEVVTNWDQGSMSFSTLADILRVLIDVAGGSLLGADICGECPPQAQYSGDPGSFAADLAQNREINRKLLDIFRNYR